MKYKMILSESHNKLIEALASAHFEQRYIQRIKQLNLPDSIEKKLNNRIFEIEENDFNPSVSYGIMLIDLKPQLGDKNVINYKGKPMYRVYDNKGKDSTGDQIWIAVRGNKITTLFLRKSTQSKDKNFLKKKLRVDVIVQNYFS